jgi:Spy/CpxP family protein refolding chaperone
MSNRVHQLIVGVGLLGLAAGAWAQGGPDSRPHGDGNGEWGHGEYHHRHHHHHHRHHGWGHGHDEWRGDRGDRGGEHGHGEMMGGGGLMLARGLNLTDAQKQQIHTILSTARQNAMKDKPGDGKAGPMSDRLALMNPGDPNYAAAVQSAKKRAADRIQHMSELKQQLYNVLTAEQKSEVQKRIASWKTRMAQRDEGAKGPPAPANR